MKSRTQIQNTILANPELVQLIGYASGSGVITEEAIIIPCKKIDKDNFKKLVEAASRPFGGEFLEGKMWFKGKYTDYLKLKNPKLARTIELNLRFIFERASRQKELAIRLVAGLLDSEAGKIGVRKKEPFVSVELPDRRLIESTSVAMNLVSSDDKEAGKSIVQDKGALAS